MLWILWLWLLLWCGLAWEPPQYSGHSLKIKYMSLGSENHIFSDENLQETDFF